MGGRSLATPVAVLRVALWLVMMAVEPGQCVWDTLSERYDGIGGDDAHSNGKDKMDISFDIQGGVSARIAGLG